MARIAFDIDEKTKREIRIRLVKENRTLSEVMRVLCLYYKNFGLPLVSDDALHDQGSEKKSRHLSWDNYTQS